MNVPYKKVIVNGEVTNPIEKGKYQNSFPNRKERRAELQKKIFLGNHKGKQLIVVNSGIYSAKYFKKVQVIKLKNGTEKRIQHWVEG